MPDMLAVATLELGHPVAFIVLVKPGDPPLQLTQLLTLMRTVAGVNLKMIRGAVAVESHGDELRARPDSSLFLGAEQSIPTSPDPLE